MSWASRLMFVLLAGAAQAEAVDENRARVNYMLNCQGCHGSTANGNDAADVPGMNGFVGNFLRVPGGRAYLVQVPGSANASISDADLAELLNWMIPYFSRDEMPNDFTAYTGREVTALRSSPEEDVLGKRAKLIKAINALETP